MENQKIVRSVDFFNTSLPLEVSSFLNKMIMAINSIVDCDWDEAIAHNSKSPFYEESDKREDMLYLGLCNILKGEYDKGVDVLKTIDPSNEIIAWIISNPEELRKQASKTGYI